MIKFLAGIAGLATPIRISAPLYLAECLRRQGIEPGKLPRKCIAELALARVRTTKMVTSLTRRSWRAEITDDLELEAIAVAYLLSNDAPYNEVVEGMAKETRAILIRHSVVAREIG